MVHRLVIKNPCEVSTEIESKHLETLMSVLHYHNIQMCDLLADFSSEEGIHQFVSPSLGTELHVHSKTA